MQASTVVTRTAAGSAELAEPAHGLSLSQRRFLTLLDTACSIDALAARHPGDGEKLRRDLARLASLGLVAFDSPAANDEHVALATVRLGPAGASSRLPYVLVPLAAGLLGLLAWHWLPSSPAPAQVPDAVKPAVAQPQRQDATPDPGEAIATRVLVSDTTPPRAREPTKEPPRTKPVETAPNAMPSAAPAPPMPMLHPMETRLAPQPFVAAPIALPVAPVHLADAAPSAAALAPAPAKLVPISQEPPAFPREAMAAGLASGNVKARLVVDANGHVSSVEIVEASHRAFDRAVRDALSRWRFEPGTAGRSTTVDVAFKRD
jgi:TonB family protein